MEDTKKNSAKIKERIKTLFTWRDVTYEEYARRVFAKPEKRFQQAVYLTSWRVRVFLSRKLLRLLILLGMILFFNLAPIGNKFNYLAPSIALCYPEEATVIRS